MTIVRLSATGILLVCLGSASFAGEIPDNIIRDQHKSYVDSCTKSSGGQTARCEKVCTCIDDEIETHFSMLDYTVMYQHIHDLESLPPDLKSKVDTLFLVCHG